MAKPRFISPCVANRYTGPNERIAEFSFPGGEIDGAGGLISLRRLNDGRNMVRLYRLDGCTASVEGATDPVAAMRATLAELDEWDGTPAELRRIRDGLAAAIAEATIRTA